MARDLTIKQRRFIDEYLIDYNASRAALAAGYNKKTAMHMGYENLKKPQIKREIDKEIAKRSEKSEITAEKIVAELALIAFSDIKYILKGKKGKKGIPIHDKVRALELLGKYRAMFTDKIKVQDDRSHIRARLSGLTTEELRKMANDTRN